MKRVSVEQAFLWAQQFVAREWRLLLPVTLAFMALPPLLVDLLVPASAQATMMPSNDLANMRNQISVVGILAGLAVVVVSCVGQLALVALGMVARISVREAIGLAFTRVPVLVAAWILICCMVTAAALPIAMLLTLAPVNQAAQFNLMFVFLIGIFLCLCVRLMPIGPLIVERPIGPIAAIRRAWELSRGAFWRLAGALIVYTLGAFVVVAALSSALGATLTIAGKALGQAEVGAALANVLFRIGVAIVSAGLQIVIVGLYRQLLASRSGI